MIEEDISSLTPEERLKLYLKQMQESRERHSADQIQRKVQLKEQRKQEKFLKKQKERKFDIDPKSRPQWRLGERFKAKELDEKNKKYLPAADLHPTELHRVSHLIPRTYIYPEKPFKLTKNKGSEFGNPKTDTLTESGKQIINNNIKKFEEEVEKRRQEEMKLKNVEFGPKWECNNTHGSFFSVPPTDPYYYFEHEMKPEYYQTKPILRTSKYGALFSYP